MKSKQGMKLPSRIAAMLTSLAVVFALMLVIGIGSAGKAYAESVVDRGNYNGTTWQVVSTDAGNELRLGESGKTQTMDRSNSATHTTPFWRVSGGTMGATGDDLYQYSENQNVGIEEKAGEYAWAKYKNTIRKIRILGEVKIIDNMDWLFADFPKLNEIIGLENIDTSEVKSMGYLFSRVAWDADAKDWIPQSSPLLTSLDLTSCSWDTSKVTSLMGAFGGLSGLEIIDISNWNTAEVQQLTGAFEYCTGLREIKLPNNFFTSKVVNAVGVFRKCTNLETIDDISKFDTSGCSSIRNMFIGCEALTSLDLSGWNTENVEDMRTMFYGCSSLTDVNLTGWKTGKVTAMEHMFRDCSVLDSIAGVEGFDTSNVKNMTFMFKGTAVENLDLSNWETGNVTNMFGLFEDSKIKNLNISDWETGNVTNMGSMFKNASDLQGIAGIEDIDTGKVTNMYSMFDGCGNLNKNGTLDLSKWDTGSLEQLGRAFAKCGMAEIDVTGWDTGKVKSMNSVFNANPNLTEIKGLDGWDTGNASSVTYMFTDDKNLKTTDMLGWDVGNARIVNANNASSNPFAGCTGMLAALDEKSNDPSYTAEEQQAFEKAKEALAKLVNKQVVDDEAIAAYKSAIKSYSAGEFDKFKQAADVAVAEAKAAEDDAKANPNNKKKQEKAAELLDKAHKAVDKAKTLAGNSGEPAQLNSANALETELKATDDSRKEREGAQLADEVAAAKEVDTTGKSAASVRAYNDAIAAAEEVLNNPNAEAADVIKAREDLENAKNGLEDKSNEEKAYDTAKSVADEAKAAAEAAKQAYEAAKAKADEEAAKNPGSDAAVKAAEEAKKAAEEYAAAAQTAKEKADAANTAAKKVDDSVLQGEANDAATAAGEEKKAADVANAEAAAAYAEQLDKAVEKETDPIKKAELANKAAEAWKDAAGKSETAGNTELKDKADEAKAKADEVAKTASDAALTQAIADAKKVDTSNATPESKKAFEDAVANAEKVLADPNATPEQKAAAAKAVADAQKNLTNVDIKVGDQFEVGGQKYEVLTLPASGNPEAAFVKGRNAKSVSVPKTVAYKGKTCDVTKINKKAFYKKTKKVTVGANVDTIDKQAFKGSKVTTVVLKTKDLTKKSVKASLKGSKVKTVQVKVGSKKVNKKFVKKYKKIFTKKNAGKKVTVK